jgi:hypothetical protein
LSAKLLPNFADKRCHVVNVTDIYGCILGFIDRTQLSASNKISIMRIEGCLTPRLTVSRNSTFEFDLRIQKRVRRPQFNLARELKSRGTIIGRRNGSVELEDTVTAGDDSCLRRLELAVMNGR